MTTNQDLSGLSKYSSDIISLTMIALNYNLVCNSAWSSLTLTTPQKNYYLNESCFLDYDNKIVNIYPSSYNNTTTISGVEHIDLKKQSTSATGVKYTFIESNLRLDGGIGTYLATKHTYAKTFKKPTLYPTISLQETNEIDSLANFNANNTNNVDGILDIVLGIRNDKNPPNIVQLVNTTTASGYDLTLTTVVTNK